MQLETYDYHLPVELIAQKPSEQRDLSRLLVINRSREDNLFEHALFRELTYYLHPGDMLVVNDTKVFPARLKGHKATGGKVEVLLVRPLDDSGRWEAIVGGAAKLPEGSSVEMAEGKKILLGKKLDEKTREIYWPDTSDLIDFAFSHGQVPLPPYIKREAGPSSPEDRERYQTVYASQTGAVAAPTAGLHFTSDLISSLDAVDVRLASVTLHVGLGTFLPVNEDHIAKKELHKEWYHVPAETLRAVEETKKRGGRVIAVGTTSVRALESLPENISSKDFQGWTRLFIMPGFTFRFVDGLITNFHLPKSSLLMLVSAFAGKERMLAAYKEAVEKRYRFFSYGDACLIL